MQGKLREVQDRFANAGWRIQHISHAEDGKPMIIGFENWAGYVAVFAMLGFPVGVGMAIYLKKHGDSPSMGVTIAAISWLICMLAVAMKNKLKKKDWGTVDATCIDREVLKVIAKQGGPTWAVRILCEIQHDGAVLQCTPTVRWSTFKAESDAYAFLNSRIDDNSSCRLKINLRNPLEANLVARSTQ